MLLFWLWIYEKRRLNFLNVFVFEERAKSFKFNLRV